MLKILILIIVTMLVFPGPGYAEVIKGVYGVPSIASGKVDIEQLKSGGVNAVFVAPDRETISAFKKQGFKVFISVNVFGGKGAWEKYPDARPVLADGTLMESGGVCPTHEARRRARLAYIEKLVSDFGGNGGIDGIWLDYIRYPGKWEVPAPDIKAVKGQGESKGKQKTGYRIGSGMTGKGQVRGVGYRVKPGMTEDGKGERAGYRVKPGMTVESKTNSSYTLPDTCYCDRCLDKFAASKFGKGFKRDKAATTQQLSSFIWNEYAFAWMQWKKENIRSFVAEARKIIDAGKQKDFILGLFAVPWKKGDWGNAVSFRFAQDVGQLSRLVDVVSPMVYHRMLSQNPEWVGAITRYFRLAAHCRVWPIVQSMQVNWDEYGRAFDAVSRAGADGILVYKWDAIQGAMWREFKTFNPPENLISNPDFLPVEGKLRPVGWKIKKARIQAGTNSRYLAVNSGKLVLRKSAVRDRNDFTTIGIHAGTKRAGEWSSQLPTCKAGQQYRFSATFYRPTRQSGAYPQVSIWGQPFVLNTSWRAMLFDFVDFLVKCPDKMSDRRFRFINNRTGHSFYLAKPELKEYYPMQPAQPPLETPALYKGMFPIGAYGANLENLEEIKAAGLNTAIIGGSAQRQEEVVTKCHELGLNYMLAVPRDPDQLILYLEKVADFADPDRLSFYVNDEPGLLSFPLHTAEDIQALIKARFPETVTTMAVLRPQVTGKFAAAADVFMLDQYPVPHMPMSWLSDSMDRAAEDVGRKRLASVIQAFGGPGQARYGWPRMPTRQEIDCLTFLSVIHGSRAIFYYTFGVVGKTKAGRDDLQWVAQRVQKLTSWLMEYNLVEDVSARMVSKNRVDAKGKAAVHACLKRKGEQLMLLATNTIVNHTEAEFEVPGVKKGLWVGTFSGAEFPVVDGVVRVRFGPYETKAFTINVD